MALRIFLSVSSFSSGPLSAPLSGALLSPCSPLALNHIVCGSLAYTACQTPCVPVVEVLERELGETNTNVADVVEGHGMRRGI